MYLHRSKFVMSVNKHGFFKTVASNKSGSYQTKFVWVGYSGRLKYSSDGSRLGQSPVNATGFIPAGPLMCLTESNRLYGARRAKTGLKPFFLSRCAVSVIGLAVEGAASVSGVLCDWSGRLRYVTLSFDTLARCRRNIYGPGCHCVT